MTRSCRRRTEEFLSAIHPADRGRINDLAEAACRGTQTYDGEFRIIRPDGEVRTVHSRGRVIHDAAGDVDAMIGMAQDVTDRKRVEEFLERAKESAEEANRVKDQFLATLSHELRTPLAGILLWGQMLESGQVGEHDRAKAVRSIVASAEAQNQLIGDLLDVSRMLSGKLRLNMGDVDLGLVVDAAVILVRPSTEAKGVRLDGPGGQNGAAEETSAGRAVRGDPDRLQQVVWNLLSNAVKFTPAGGRVAVRLEWGDATVRVVVSDTGTGISQAFLPHVFDRFRQADASSTRAHGGLGLGLAIVRELVQLHGGRVYAESPGEGLGATFTVELPAGAGGREGADPGGAVPAAAGSSADRPLDGLRLLLVEDDAPTREALAWALQVAGARVTVAATAAAARAVLALRETDLLISDIGLPGEDGHSLVRGVRRAEAEGGGPRLPAVALTAYARPEDRESALAAGFDAHAAKPIGGARLVRTVAGLGGRGP